MGQRGARAAFMPDRFVFPGGAVDAEDRIVAAAAPVPGELAAQLAVETAPEVALALPLTAIRELWEETGLCLGRSGAGSAPQAVPANWAGFFAAGLCPSPDVLRFVFRAVTPPGRPRRFDARFFLASADDLHGDADDLSGAGDELRHLHWVDLAAARRLPLPFITEIVLSEVEALLGAPEASRGVPFFHHTGKRSEFRQI